MLFWVLKGEFRCPGIQVLIPIHIAVANLLQRNVSAILSASYAGTLSLSSPALPPPSNMTFSGHGLSVLSCCYVPNPNSQAGKQWVASGGMDRVARVWEYEVSCALTCFLFQK